MALRLRLFRFVVVTLTALALASTAYEVSRIPAQPVLGMSEQGTQVRLVREGGAAWKAGLRDGDRIVEIDGRPASEFIDASAFLRSKQGRTQLVVTRPGRTFSVELIPDTAPPSEVAWDIAFAAAATVILLIGALVAIQRTTVVGGVFFGICLGLAILIFRPFAPPTEPAQSLVTVIVRAIGALLPALFLHFFTLFPFERRWIKDRPWIQGLIYIPFLFLGPVLIGGTLTRDRLGIDLPVWERISELGPALHWVIAVGLSLFLFLRSHRSSPLPIVRRKFNVTLIGALLGLVPMLLVIIVRSFLPDLPLPGDRLAILTIVFVPASFGYAILRRGIMDTEVLVQRSYIYSAAISAFILLYFGFFFVMRSLLQDAPRFEWNVGTGIALAFALFLMSPARKRLQDLLDRWIYPDRYEIRRPLRDTAVRLREAAGTGNVESSILLTLDSTLRLERAVLFRPERVDRNERSERPERLDTSDRTDRSDGQRFVSRCSLGFGSQERVVMTNGNELVLSRHLAGPILRSGRPIRRVDLEDELPYGYLPETDLIALRAVSARVLVPLSSPREDLGILALGPKDFSERYADTDLDLLEGFQAQAALALENEVLERQKAERIQLEEELDVAQSIQKQLLPTSLPRLPRVDLAGGCNMSAAVGGDLYDCRMLEDGALLLAIGDVTGHGIAAALLMANVQATLQAQVLAGSRPDQVMGSLNRQLCAIEAPERFATFFAARFDPADGRLVYCNAGHPQPILARRSGCVERLDQGGLLLGIVTDAEYTVGQVSVDVGDVLLFHTDGVIEQGGTEGAFDETRLVEFVAANRHLSAADLLGRVREQIDAPVDESHADDATLLVVKVL